MNTTSPIVCDTSGLVALADRADPDHAAVVSVMEEATGPFVVSPLVVAEVDHLLRTRLSAEAARSFAADIAIGAYELASMTRSDVAACLDVDRRYSDLGLGLADAHLVVLADAYRTTALLTLDQRHMRAVRPLHGRGGFALLPADVPTSRTMRRPRP